MIRLKLTKRELVSESVSQSVSDKHCQWSDSGPVIMRETPISTTTTLLSKAGTGAVSQPALVRAITSLLQGGQLLKFSQRNKPKNFPAVKHMVIE